jgi:hypothetical protein
MGAWQQGKENLRLDHHLYARQLGGERAAIDATLLDADATTGEPFA